jgi:outer membrane protein assembly factor BamB
VYERYPISTVAPRALQAIADAAIARGHRQRAEVALRCLLEHHATEIDEASVRAKLAGDTPRAAASAPVIGELRFPAKTFEVGGSAPNRFAPGQPSGPDTLARHRPQVHGDRVFVATADQVLSYDVNTGEEGQRIARIGPAYFDPNPKVQFGVAVVGSMLVVPVVQEVLRDQQYRGIPIKVKIPLRKLAGLDLEGSRWTWNHARLLEGTPMERWSFASPPAAFEGAVIAAAFGPLAHPLIDSNVVAFDARTGERRWDRRVGGGQVEQTMFGEQASEPLCTPVTVNGGIVYHSTSFGSVAALDASTGRPLWITAYELIEVRAPRGYYADPRVIGWENNAPVVQSGVVVVAPMDSPRYYGFDARTGRRLWSQGQRASAADAEMKFIMGAAEANGEGVVVLAGRDQVRCVSVRTGKLLWSQGLRGRVVAGRGCISNGVVLVPVDRDEVFTLDLATGKRGASFQVGATGNVTLAGEHVLITGNGVLAVHAAGR